MSGGHFNYGCFGMSQFNEELQHEIKLNDVQTKDKYGDSIGRGFSEYTMERIIASQKIIKLAAELAKEVDWLYSGDHSEESFRELVDKILCSCEAIDYANL